MSTTLINKSKSMEIDKDDGESEEQKKNSVTQPSHGFISVIGRQRVMEDAVTVAIGRDIEFTYDFFAVYDGHGGARAANACRDRLHLIIAKEVEEEEEEGRTDGGGGCRGLDFWERVMTTSFRKMDEEVRAGGGDVEEYSKRMGTTAVVVMVGEEEFVVANCGNSRAVLCRDGVAVPLSRDQKAAGKVINKNGIRLAGVLATSRSIRDEQNLKYHAITQPEVSVNERKETDDFLIIASDGLWDVVSNDVACKFVRRCLDYSRLMKKLSEEFKGSCAAWAAARLAELAMARGSQDNISVILVELKNEP